MQVNSVNKASFGQIILSKATMQKIGYTLHRKSIKGERDFLNTFYEHWEKCSNTKVNDLVITSEGKVFIQNKRSGKQTEINNSGQVMSNVLSGLKQVAERENSRIYF